jgi:hypothetical protein
VGGFVGYAVGLRVGNSTAYAWGGVVGGFVGYAVGEGVGNFAAYVWGRVVGGFVGYVGREILTDGTVRVFAVGILVGDLLYILVGFVVSEFLSFLVDGFRVGDSTSFLESLFVGLRVGNKEGLSTTRENTGLDS